MSTDLEYPILQYTAFCVPFKRSGGGVSVAWPRQPCETVFTTSRILAKISTYASGSSLAYFITVLARISKPDTPLSVDNFLQAVFPNVTSAEIAVFKHRDKRGLMPWMQLATLYKTLARPRTTALTPRTFYTGGGCSIWVLAQTSDNQRVFVHILGAVILRVVKPAPLTHLKAPRQYDSFVGTPVKLKEFTSVKTGLKKVCLLLLGKPEESKWSIIQYGVEDAGEEF